MNTIKYPGYTEKGQLSQLIWGLRRQHQQREVHIENMVFDLSLQVQIVN